MLSLRHCKVNHYFSDYQVFTAFFYVFNSIVFSFGIFMRLFSIFAEFSLFYDSG